MFKRLIIIAIVLVFATLYAQSIVRHDGTFVRVTQLDEITTGYYVVLGSSTGSATSPRPDAVTVYNAMSNNLYGSGTTIHLLTYDNIIAPEDIDIVDPVDAVVWYIAETSTNGQFTLFNEEVSKYISHNDSGNNVQLVDNVTTDNQKWTIIVSPHGGVLHPLFRVSNVGIPTRSLQYNYTYNNRRFACYTNTQADLALYKFAGEVIPDQVATPSITPAAGTYYTPQTISMSCTTENATIYYTLDETDPDESSTEYTGTFVLDTTTTVKARAYATGMEPSSIVTRAYIITRPTVATPRFTPPAGVYFDPLTVEIICPTDSVTIYYTTDGTDPDDTATLYENPISVTETMTIKAIAMLEDYFPSEIITGNYSFLAEMTSGNYYRVTQLDELTTGYYVVLGSSAGSSSSPQPNAVTVYNAMSNNYLNTTYLAIYEDIITPSVEIVEPPSAVIWYFEETDGQWTIYNEEIDKYVSYTGSSNNVQIVDNVTADNQRWAINISPNGNSALPFFRVSNVAIPTRSLMYNFQTTPSDYRRYACYANTMGDLTLYKLYIEEADPMVATPVITPPAGEYFVPQTISITCATDGTTIYYTTDGTAPDESSLIYTEPFQISTSTTVKAKAYATDILPSEIATNDYTISLNTVATPFFTPTAGVYSQPIMVEISCETDSARIYYTIDDTEPTEASPLYTEPFQIAISTVVNARAFATDMIPSAFASGVFVIQFPTVATPVITPPAGSYTDPITIEISCADSTAIIYYTLDGTEPDSTATLYETPFEISESMTIKAIAYAEYHEPSEIASNEYTFIVPILGTFVRVTDIDELTTGHYVILGSSSGSSSSPQPNAVTVYNAMTNIHNGTFFALMENIIESGEEIVDPQPSVIWFFEKTDSLYTIYNQALDKYVSYTGSSNNVQIVDNVTTDNQRWTIAPSPHGSSSHIFFRVSNAAVTGRSLMYNPTSGQQRFACYGNTQGDLSLYKLYIEEDRVATPTISPAGGLYYAPFMVSIECETPNAEIHYTTDGTTPDETSPEYTTPFEVSSTTTVRAKAFKTDYVPSATTSMTYTFPVQIANLSELRAQTAGTNTIYHLTNEVIVTFTQEYRNQIYIQDETAGVLIDDQNGIITTEYEIGDGITGLLGTIMIFGDMLQLVPYQDSGAPTSTGSCIEPIVTTFSVLNDDPQRYQARLVRVNGVTFTTTGVFSNGAEYTISDETGNYTFRANFYDVNYIGIPLPTKPVDIIGLISARSSGSHIAARYLADLIGEEIDNEDETLPRNTSALIGNYPNPFNPSTTISFTIAVGAHNNTPVQIEIYNIKGQRVKSLVNTTYPTGNHTIVWNGNDDNGQPVSSGLYFYRMKTDDFVQTKRMILLK